MRVVKPVHKVGRSVAPPGGGSSIYKMGLQLSASLHWHHTLTDDGLHMQLDEVEAEVAPPPQPQLPWQGGSGDAMLSDGPPQPEHFFQALESNPLSLQPTFHTMDMNQQPVPAPGSCYPPAWMA